jgi:prepilin-type processing-associated H-X9-DG protein
VRILPYAEQENHYHQLDLLGTGVPGGNVGWIGGAWPNSTANPRNRTVLMNSRFPFMFCPSSSLPQGGLVRVVDGAVNVQSCTYGGISGSFYANSAGYPVNNPATKLSSIPDYISTGGTLIAGRGVPVAQITDGTSNTMMVGEQSDWCVDSNGSLIDNCRSDHQHGFQMGINPNNPQQFNLTCVIHPIGETSKSAYGVETNNSPIASAHPGGATVLMADSSVQFLSKSTAIATLYNLCNRNDNNTLGKF